VLRLSLPGTTPYPIAQWWAFRGAPFYPPRVYLLLCNGILKLYLNTQTARTTTRAVDRVYIAFK